MRRTRIAAVVVGIFTFLAGYSAGQRQAPTQNVGQSEELLRSIDLTNELDSSKGRPLRMRKVTLQPGGVLGLHPVCYAVRLSCPRAFIEISATPKSKCPGCSGGELDVPSVDTDAW